MEMDQKNVYLGLGILIVAIAIWWFFLRKKKVVASGDASAPVPSSGGTERGKPTIYGSLGCPYTVKQMEKYPEHEFVDCSTPGSCPSFVTAYPTTKWPDGKIDVGYM